jgi:hypothetical protein
MSSLTESTRLVELFPPKLPSTPIRVPVDFELGGPSLAFRENEAILFGRFAFPRRESERAPRLCLDLAPRFGVFAAWAFTRFPYLWFDVVELELERRRLCYLNAPPGTKLVDFDLLAEIRKQADDAPGIRLALVADVVHLEAPDDGELGAMPIDWGSTSFVFVEAKTSRAFSRGAEFFGGMCQMKILAAGEIVPDGTSFQVWGRA